MVDLIIYPNHHIRLQNLALRLGLKLWPENQEPQKKNTYHHHQIVGHFYGPSVLYSASITKKKLVFNLVLFLNFIFLKQFVIINLNRCIITYPTIRIHLKIFI